MCHLNGLPSNPRVVAELGPGDSLGTGIAALLSGAERYVALDTRKFAVTDVNLQVFDELVELFRRREPVPGPNEFPEVKPSLPQYEFPYDLLCSGRLERALAPARVAAIREALVSPRPPHEQDAIIAYAAPWQNTMVLREGSVDMILSQAVLEHVDNLNGAYASMRLWLTPGGVSSHQIDFRSHGTASTWDGHWTYGDWVWRLIRGRRPYLINRMPYTVHIRLLRESGFRVKSEQRVEQQSSLVRASLAIGFRGLSDRDLCTAGLFVQAVRE